MHYKNTPQIVEDIVKATLILLGDLPVEEANCVSTTCSRFRIRYFPLHNLFL